MHKNRLGHGLLRAEVLDDPYRPQLLLRDDVGVVVMLPVHHASLPAVRRHLTRRGEPQPCVLELQDVDGTVRERWGTFAGADHAAATAVTLLASDHHADRAVVLAGGSGGHGDGGGRVLATVRGNPITTQGRWGR